MHLRHKRTYFSLAIFLVGLLVTIVALQFPTTEQFIGKLGQAGFLGAFVGGILYAFALTSSLATAIFLNHATDVHPLLIAFAGGLGSALYDLTVFAFIRRESHRSFLDSFRQRFSLERRLPAWLLTLIGLIIIASPLPDELAAGLLGFTDVSIKKFITLSFLANTAGILFIISVS